MTRLSTVRFADDMGRFNLITSFEVFEHVPDVNHLISTLSSLVEEDGIVLFSTYLSDGKIARNQPLAVVVRVTSEWTYQSVFSARVSRCLARRWDSSS